MMLLRSSRLCAALLALATAVQAQQVASNEQVQQKAARPSSPMSQIVTVNAKQSAIKTVVQSIAAQAGLKVFFNDSDPLVNKLVDAKITNRSSRDAIGTVLAGSGLVAQYSPDGETVTLRRGNSQSSKSTGVVTGRVIDASTKEPVKGATVSIASTQQTTTTGEDGTYTLLSVADGSHTVMVRSLGYAKQSRVVSVGNNATVSANFALEASTSVLDQVVVTGTVVSTELKAVPNAISVVTAKQIEERGITRVDQLFRGDIPGLFAINLGTTNALDSVAMYSRGGTKITIPGQAASVPIRTYVDGVELVDPAYQISQIDPRSIERIEILTGPQATTIYGSNAINGVMQIFTKRGTSARPQFSMSLMSGLVENNFSTAVTPQHSYDARVSGTESRIAYNIGGSWDYTGAWSPAKQMQRLSGYGGGRMQAGSKLNIDVSARQGLTTNLQRGHAAQANNDRRLNGEWIPTSAIGVAARTTTSLSSRTAGLTVGYTPLSWWSHDLVLGTDRSNRESMKQAPGFTFTSDTLLSYLQDLSERTSQRYTTTARIPVMSSSLLTLTLGGDHWVTRGLTQTATPSALTGTLATPAVTRNRPARNTGGFFQGQLGLNEALFFTYGLRAEWNPNYGEEAQPNLTPRYGVAYTRNVGPVTAKLRASYGRSTRPPEDNQRLAAQVTTAALITTYGNHVSRFGNDELGPEYQQGGEGGLELYMGNRGSLVVTRYNQTVDALIISVPRIDSVRSLVQNPTTTTCTPQLDGYCYSTQSQYLNVGSVRNQGWELQGSVNTGPFTTRGTYSWTKSRVIGVTEKYRSRLTGTQYQEGRSPDFFPEHTWALQTTYSKAKSTVSFNLNGVAQLYRSSDELSAPTNTASMRLWNQLFRAGLPAATRYVGKPYVMADINASQRFTQRIDGVLQVLNIGDYYRNDTNVGFAVIGRQSKAGLRVNF